jgi:hypothetical protein
MTSRFFSSRPGSHPNRAIASRHRAVDPNTRRPINYLYFYIYLMFWDIFRVQTGRCRGSSLASVRTSEARTPGHRRAARRSRTNRGETIVSVPSDADGRPGRARIRAGRSAAGGGTSRAFSMMDNTGRSPQAAKGCRQKGIARVPPRGHGWQRLPGRYAAAWL